MREKIALMIDMRIETLTVSGVSTFEQYEYSMGYLKALKDVLTTMEEVEE
jgi:hypothetical protein